VLVKGPVHLDPRLSAPGYAYGVIIEDAKSLEVAARQPSSSLANASTVRQLQARGDGGERRGGAEDHVPARDVGAHVSQPGIAEEGGELLHGELVLAAHVDSAQEGDVGAEEPWACRYLGRRAATRCSRAAALN